ncbi:unnamed protein product [Medioppia subpectinata]|uniref:Uncharacterized protein n=1 Tax=Medioppia subpectinata TaxID=1979941 RepID=A0A7R9Q1T0_9ACAR|nr:unnamed protein product [Medioppia subpectinata]CAG2109581.1 unnamed protein product [Medioppia subpectinata]
MCLNAINRFKSGHKLWFSLLTRERPSPTRNQLVAKDRHLCPNYCHIRGYWRVTKGSAFIQTSKSSDEFTLDVNEITAGDKFSYSCSQLKIASKNTSNSAQIRLKFSEFQLQPFENPVNKKIVFTSSESCEVWMTLPLWMGLITLSLLTVILLLGLYLLYRVATPDRFENPKGKPLIVAAADEQ